MSAVGKIRKCRQLTPRAVSHHARTGGETDRVSTVRRADDRRPLIRARLVAGSALVAAATCVAACTVDSRSPTADELGAPHDSGTGAGGGAGSGAATTGGSGGGVPVMPEASTGAGGRAGTGGSSGDGGMSGGAGEAGADDSGGGSAAGGSAGMRGTVDAAVRDASSGSPDGGDGTAGTVVSLFDGTTLSGWLPSSGTGVGNAPASWDVLDGALHCTGTVRGTLISRNDYGNFRLIFNVRQLPSTGTDNHYASVLIWGARPPPNDAIGGIQFGNPNGYFWDYRPGHNNSGAAFFVSTSGGYSRTNWAQCEILTNIATGVARMACCSLGTATSCKATEVLKFTDPTAGRIGPIALQAHSVGGHDEYKNITIEENPTINDLITTK